jgi:hypothetical protein
VGHFKIPKSSSGEKKEPHKRDMSTMLMRALVVFVPTGMLFFGSIVLFSKGKSVYSFLQLLGAGCIVVVVLTHVFEALHLLPLMHWGSEHSAALGVTLFPAGYLCCALNKSK